MRSTNGRSSKPRGNAPRKRFKRTGEHTKEPVKELGVAARHLIDEIKRGYARVREQLKETH